MKKRMDGWMEEAAQKDKKNQEYTRINAGRIPSPRGCPEQLVTIPSSLIITGFFGVFM